MKIEFWIGVLAAGGGIIRLIDMLYKNKTAKLAETGNRFMDKAQEQVEALIHPLLAEDEQVILIDSYGNNAKYVLAMTDMGIYCIKKGKITFQSKYSQIIKCKYTDLQGKENSDHPTVSIEIKSQTGRCYVRGFGKLPEIIQILYKNTNH